MTEHITIKMNSSKKEVDRFLQDSKNPTKVLIERVGNGMEVLIGWHALRPVELGPSFGTVAYASER